MGRDGGGTAPVGARRQMLLALVNGCTAGNLVLGMTALFAASQGHGELAAWCLFASVFFDAADGALARLFRVSSEFGAQLDSLADMTSFIVAGSAVTFFWFSPGLPHAWMGAAASLYAVTGACRLARFNSAPTRVDGEFQGLPSTAMAALVAVTYLTCPGLDCQWGLFLTITLSLLMVSYYPYPKWNKLIKLPLWFFALLGLAGLCYFKPAVWGCEIAYLASGPAIWLHRKLR